jgi:hypothetical protein
VLKFVIVVLLFAAATYMLVRLIERRGVSRPGPSAPTQRPLGPDDDPDFIWGLNKKRRHPDDDPP